MKSSTLILYFLVRSSRLRIAAATGAALGSRLSEMINRDFKASDNGNQYVKFHVISDRSNE